MFKVHKNMDSIEHFVQMSLVIFNKIKYYLQWRIEISGATLFITKNSP
jgi:hypothetical protein